MRSQDMKPEDHKDFVEDCDHELVRVLFDIDRAKTMTTAEIRKAYPRFWGNCPTCGRGLIKYASTAHYVYGDW
jgi:hypothetical protein